jgi:probable F420-dependent oxidoreductase
MSVRIGLGIANFPFSSAAAFWRWVDVCEESDLDSIWCSDRLATPLPFLEPMSAMAALAGATSRIKFGMNAVVLPFRDPLVLAKECATIDYLSDGRLLPVFGVGADTAPEWKATGRTPEGRGAWSDEALEIMARLWSEPSVTHEGKHLNYHEVSIAPRPVQQPLPLWIGGSSPAAIRRTARIGTGWLAGIQTPAQVAPVVRSIKEEAAKAGRSIDEDHYGAGFPFRFGAWDDPIVERTSNAYARIAPGFSLREAGAVGGAREIVGRVQDYVDAGVSKFVLRPMAEGDDEIMSQTRRLIDEVLPLVHS